MLITATLPTTSGLRLDGMAVAADTVIVVLTATHPEAACPLCGRHAQRVHSRYRRRVADLPWQGIAVCLEVQVRRFWCDDRWCPRRIFAERLPGLVAAGARRSDRLTTLCLAVSLALGGEAGARLVAEMGLRVSPDTLLRLALTTPPATSPTPRVLGVDDWSWRRGQRWGTILVDLERHAIIDLLPDRTATTLATWLRAHPGVQYVTRDRAGAYADGIRQGAPQAIQIADRFHLAKNAGEALERLAQRHHSSLRAAATAVDQALAVTAAPLTPLLVAEEPALPAATSRASGSAASRDRRLARYEAVIALRAEGVPLRAIARQVGMGRATLRRFLGSGAFPERAPRARCPTGLTPYEPYLRDRWTAGCQNARQLWEEIQAQGYQGSASMVRHFLAPWRAAPGRPGRPSRASSATASPSPPVRHPTRPLSPRQARWLLLTPDHDLEPEQRRYLDQLGQVCPDLLVGQRLTLAFLRLLRERDLAALAPWLSAARASGLRELRELANGILRDRAAVEAALQHDWSNGQTEAQVLQLKVVRRQMRGRGRFELVRRRVVKEDRTPSGDRQRPARAA